MTTIDAEPVPGTTLKDLIEQNEFLNEFLTLVRKRFELDRDYQDKLRALRASANPKWENSAIWPLISPFLHLLDEETRLREQTTDLLFARLEEVPEYESPDRIDNEGVPASVKYEELRPSYDKYQACLSSVNTVESIASLQAWYQQSRIDNKWAWEMTEVEIEAYVFPEIDRSLRASVITQQEHVHSAIKWHDEILPTQLDAYQARVEEVKSLLSDVSTNSSQLASVLTQSFATLTHSIASVAPSRIIALFHDQRDLEASHALLQPAVYLNFYTDGLPAKPLFGLKMSEKSVNEFMRVLSFTGYIPLSIAEAFKIEKDPRSASFSVTHSSWSQLTWLQQERYHDAAVLCLLSSPPLVSLPKGTSNLPYENWTRKKLKVLMRGFPNESKDSMCPWVFSNFSQLFVATMLFHDKDAEELARAIRAKWDFDNDAPLPDGVIRRFRYREVELIWKKTEEPYIPPIRPKWPIY